MLQCWLLQNWNSAWILLWSSDLLNKWDVCLFIFICFRSTEKRFSIIVVWEYSSDILFVLHTVLHSLNSHKDLLWWPSSLSLTSVTLFWNVTETTQFRKEEQGLPKRGDWLNSAHFVLLLDFFIIYKVSPVTVLPPPAHLEKYKDVSLLCADFCCSFFQYLINHTRLYQFHLFSWILPHISTLAYLIFV